MLAPRLIWPSLAARSPRAPLGCKPAGSFTSVLFACCALLAFAASAAAQPQIGSLDPRAIHLGTEQLITVQGAGYDDSTRLVSDIALQQRIVDVQPGRITFSVSADGLPGLHPIWLANQQGLSSSVLVAIDSIPTVAWQDSIEQLPAALHGDLRGNVILRTSFPVKREQRVAIEVESKRLGGALQPVVRVWDGEGRQVAAATPDPMIGGDSRTSFVAEADGTLTLELSDLLRRGATPGTFRLKIGDFPLVDAVLPLAVGPSTASGEGQALDQPDVAAALPSGERHSTWLPAIVGQGSTAMLPMVRVVPWNQMAAADITEPIPAPASITGDLTKGQPDRIRFQVPAGQRVAVELWSYRLGIEGDFVIDARTAAGQGLGRADDSAGSRDPRLEFAVPADQTEIEIVVSELLGKRDSSPYLLEVTPLDQPRVLATLDTDHVAVGRNPSLLAVSLGRTNYGGDVALRLEPEIPGVHIESVPCPGVADRALLRLWADGPFPDQVVRVVADADQATDLARRSATSLPSIGWLSEPVAVAFHEGATLSVSTESLGGELPLWQGANQRVTVSVTRGEGLEGPVRLSLETSQKMPRKIVKQDNQDREVDAVEQALRLESPVTIPANADSAEVVLVVPVDLPAQAWNVAIIAEALSADGNTVLARSSSPITTTQVRPGLALTLSSPATVPFGPGAEAPVVIEGSIERLNGLSSGAIVMIDGLPGMLMSPEAELTDDSTFRLEVSIPAEAKIEEWGNVHVVARAWDADGFLTAESPRVKLTFQVPQ
ncbi:MAG: hypothetical protein KDA83_10830 [Planctomycetales bacterium]|nr:hypothetical protein [Planctomycetales bacterium]